MTQKNFSTLLLRQLVFIFLSLPLFLTPQDPAILLKLPFRFAPPHFEPETLKTENLSLKINGQARPIISLLIHQRRFNDDSGKKAIILSIVSGHPNQDLRYFLDLLYRDTLSPGDRLCLCTPLSTIQIRINHDEQAAFPEDAFQKLGDDLDTFTGMLHKLEKNIAVTASKLPPKTNSAQWIKQFSLYEKEVSRLQKHLLAAVVMRIGQGLDQINADSYTPWLILIGDDRPVSEYVSWPFTELKGENQLPPDTLTRIKNLHRALDPAQEPLLSDLAQELLLRRVSLMAFVMGEIKRSNTHQNYLDQLCLQCGIAPKQYQDPAQIALQIRSCTDTFFELIYSFDGIIEDKHFLVQSLQGNHLIIHPTQIKAQAFHSLAGLSDKEAFSIGEAAVNEATLHCRIVGIHLQSEGNSQTGRVRVRLRISDESGQVRFDQEKDLSASQNSITIRLPIPPTISGYLGVTIDATDLNTQKHDQKRVYGKK